MDFESAHTKYRAYIEGKNCHFPIKLRILSYILEQINTLRKNQHFAVFKFKYFHKSPFTLKHIFIGIFSL